MTTLRRLNPLRRDVVTENTCTEWWKTYASSMERRIRIGLTEIEAHLLSKAYLLRNNRSSFIICLISQTWRSPMPLMLCTCRRMSLRVSLLPWWTQASQRMVWKHGKTWSESTEIWSELLRPGRYFHRLVTPTFLRCHILPRLLSSMCLMRCHNLLQLVPGKCIMRCHSLLNKHNRYMNNECLLKKVMHKKMRTCLNGNSERRFQST